MRYNERRIGRVYNGMLSVVHGFFHLGIGSTVMKLSILLWLAGFIRTSTSVLCEVGEALKDPNYPAVDRTCDAGSCPSGYVCTSEPEATVSVCCPVKAAVCLQPQYTGSTCGTAVPSIRYYFDASRGSCQTFTYNGCFGNDNNFYDREDCERTCLSNFCPKGMPVRTGSGVQQCQIGSNQCPYNHECVASTSPVLTGHVCCPSAASICNRPMQTGMICSSNSQPLQRYYYDSQTRTCIGFLYQGCRGNDNNFATVQECLQFCSGIGVLCPLNTAAAPGVTVSTSCASSAQCPPGYTCQYSPIQSQSYCCSADAGAVSAVRPLSTQLCPSGMASAPGTTIATTCSETGTCAFGYMCTPSPFNGQMYCCSQASVEQLCPTGSSPAPGVNALTPCNTFKPCPPSYSCQYSFTQRQSYCCSSLLLVQGSAQLCPIGSYAAPGTTVDAPCRSSAVNSCPVGYTCQTSGLTQLSYCCSSPNQLLCPVGSIAAPGITITTPCNQYTTCLAGYTCQYSPTQQQSYCCSGIARGVHLCPAGTPPATEQPCLSGLQCPIGYTCLQSSNGQSYCCSNATFAGQFCPAGNYPAPDTTIATPCSMASSCPPGFNCQYSAFNGQSYCCSADRFDQGQQYCPVGSTVAPGSDSIRNCLPYNDLCPLGYTCQPSPVTQQWHCCSATYAALCPVGSVPAPGTTVTSICTQLTGCPPGYSCQNSPYNGKSYCCQNGYPQVQVDQVLQLQQLCPVGTAPAPEGNANAPCLSSATCRPGYTCQRSPSSAFSYCCSSVTSVSAQLQMCPFGSTVAPGATVEIPCSTNTVCPSGYMCQQSPANGLLYCCSQLQTFTVNGQCPHGGAPLYYPNTQQPVSCALDGQQCAYPYYCQVSPGAASGICCATQNAGGIDQDCPAGLAVVHNSGQITYCSFGSTPQPQMCPPLSLCLMSITRQVLVCCHTYRKLTSKAENESPRPAIPCETDKECAPSQANCVDGNCQCSNGVELTSELDKCQTNATTTVESDLNDVIFISTDNDNTNMAQP